jgi:threonine synthase
VGGQRFRAACKLCNRSLDDGFLPFCPACGGMCDIDYELSAVAIEDSDDPYIRFADLLPLEDRRLLPEGEFTPTVHAKELGRALDMRRLYLKDETKLPTATTKDRMAGVALAYLEECGVGAFATSSTGNSSTAYAHALPRIPGLEMYLFTASQFRHRVHASGDRIVNFILRDATFVEAFDAARDFAEEHGIVSERGFFNPGRREGLKLAFLEAADQVPRSIDWYVQAVSSAMGVYGVFKGAMQLRGLGRIDRVPRLLCVQQDTCAPMVSAWEAGSDRIRERDVVARPTGIASAILRGNPTRAYPPVRELVVESGGDFVAVSQDEIRAARRLVEECEGISPCFAAAAAVAGVARARRLERVPADHTVLVNLTGGDRPDQEPAADARWLERSEYGWVSEDEPSARGDFGR